MSKDTSPSREQRIERRYRSYSLSSLFFFLGLFVLVGFILWIGQGVLVPLTISAFLSFLIVTVKRRLQRLPLIGSILPESIVFALSFVLIVSVLFVLIAIIRNNVEAVIDAAPAYNRRLTEIWRSLTVFATDLPGIGSDVRASLDNLSDNAGRVVQGYLGDVANIARGAIGSLVTILLYTAFMLGERGRLIKKLSVIAGREDGELFINNILDDIARLVREYISVKTLTSFIVGFISWLIMLALGIDFAGFWALLIFSLNFIPIIGSIVAVILPTLLALVQPGGSFGLFLLTGFLLTAAEQAVGSFLEPRLMGRSLNLSPLIILLSLASWGTLWGVAGAFLCVPITVALMIIFAQFEATRPVAVLLSDNGDVESLRYGRSSGSNLADAAAPL